ncbi:Uncharacterized protein M6B38_243960 [Iris pallida]|uniref:HXXXD-type acyl-transferase family protein n=1 Tax=Iris pallida TaxID=29817 RepID=A0AAX6DHK2_IRIPA|nr:Uncharacterized protein M6B38_243960 [Iris pallida]
MAASDSIPKQLHIEAMQSALPGQLTETGQSRAIAVVGAGPLCREALQSRLRVVLYYRKTGEDDSAEAVAAWAKESLSAALAEYPGLAGRLRNDREGDGFWDVKLNDAGVRLVQATAEVGMDEFLESEGREAMEEKLAYWADIDRDKPDVSALFYIQVTEFKGDGYSIGITCSLLLADPQLLARFLKQWALCHSQTVARAALTTTSIFHPSYFRKAKQRPVHLKSLALDSAAAATDPAAATVLFKFPWDPERRAPALAYSALAWLCVDEASRALEPGTGAAVSEFFLIVSDPVDDSMRVELCRKEERPSGGAGGFGRAANYMASWDELGLDGLALAEGNEPVHVSYRTVPSGRAGLVVVMLPPDDVDCAPELMVAATVPKRI